MYQKRTSIIYEDASNLSEGTFGLIRSQLTHKHPNIHLFSPDGILCSDSNQCHYPPRTVDLFCPSLVLGPYLIEALLSPNVFLSSVQCEIYSTNQLAQVTEKQNSLRVLSFIHQPWRNCNFVQIPPRVLAASLSNIVCTKSAQQSPKREIHTGWLTSQIDRARIFPQQLCRNVSQDKS